MHEFEGSLLLDLPASEDVVAVGVPIGCDLLVDAHELEGLLELRETAPVLLPRLPLLPPLLLAALVDPPYFLGSEWPVDHEYLGDEQLRACLVEPLIAILAGVDPGLLRWVDRRHLAHLLDRVLYLVHREVI